MAARLILFTWLLNVLATKSASISKHIDCVDVSGSDPIWSGFMGMTSNATCPPEYSLTSCNAKKIDNSAASEGTYIDEEQNKLYCVASNPWKMMPPYHRIRAFARCCNLTDYGDSFQYDWNQSSSDSNDAIITVNCGSNEQLIGCGGTVDADGDHTYFDGSYAENQEHIGNTSMPFIITSNKCTTQNGPNGEGVITEAQCYDTATITDGYQLKCISVWGSRSDIGGYQNSTVSCPSDPNFNYFMTSCSGFSDSAAIDSYYIENNVCTVLDTGANYAYANAICCSMTKDVGATPSPSKISSATPSKILTPSPSINPSATPTKNPTLNPSTSPTLLPSYNPSIAPTLFPSHTPSTFPSLFPSYNPSKMPTNFPSNGPTYMPSISPTTKDDNVLIADDTPKPTTTTTTYKLQSTVFVPKDDENITESVTTPAAIVSYFAIGTVLGCCVFLACGICICCKRNKNSKYSIDVNNVPNKKRVMSRSMIKEQIRTEKQNIGLEMSNIEKLTSMSHDEDEGTGTGTGSIITKETPGSANVMSNEYIIDDDMVNTITPGTNGYDGTTFINNVMNDEEITASDEETPGTDDPEINDETDEQGLVTVGHEDNEVIIEGSFNNYGANELMVGTPQ